MFYAIVAGLILFLLINIIGHMPEDNSEEIKEIGSIYGNEKMEIHSEVVRCKISPDDIRTVVSAELEAKIAQEYAKMHKEGSS